MPLPGRPLLAFACACAALALAGCATPRLSRVERQQLAGRTYVLVGASSGFGQGAALALGAEHANVVLAARRADLLEEVATRIRAAGGQALVVPTDIADPKQVEALATAAVGRFGRIDVWMNIAGTAAFGRFWEIPVADHARLVQVNYTGVIYGSHAALNQFMRQGRGTLVNMGSVESVVPLAYHANYSGTKAAILALDRALNQEIRHAGRGKTIKVATVMPWAVDTPLWGHAANYTGKSPRMIMLDGPEKVVNALLWTSLHPREELAVGWKARGAVTAHWLLPDLTERISANIQRAELNKAPPAPVTPGNLHVPLSTGRGTDGGVRARIKAEDAARENAGHR
jgi:short-subunit dehydrogenase